MKTPNRTLRVPDDEWSAAARRATERGESLTDVVRAALCAYASGDTLSAAADACTEVTIPPELVGPILVLLRDDRVPGRLREYLAEAVLALKE